MSGGGRCSGGSRVGCNEGSASAIFHFDKLSENIKIHIDLPNVNIIVYECMKDINCQVLSSLA